MTGTEFIVSAFYDECTFNEPHEITPEEAAETIKAWKDEGFTVPASVTPNLFAKVWNTYCMKQIK